MLDLKIFQHSLQFQLTALPFVSKLAECCSGFSLHFISLHTLLDRSLNGTFQGQFTSKLSMAEIRHQHKQAPLAASISPLAISPSTLMNEMRPDHNTGNYIPYSFRQVCGFFYVPHDRVNSEGL